MQRLCDWFDGRTGYRNWLQWQKDRSLPDGPCWFRSLAKCLLWLMVIQGVTGLLLMSRYSPSTTAAWASVNFMEQTPGGGLLRALHYYNTQAIIIVLAIHLAHSLLTVAFRAPRELTWAAGVLLLPLVLTFTVTGNPLAGTQRGFAQIEVEGNIMASAPGVGPALQRVLIGGDRVGNLTLTHLYTLHIVVLPLLTVLLLAFHGFQVARHGLAPRQACPTADALPYWPEQSIRNARAFLVIFGAVFVLALWKGAPIHAPAGIELPHEARPEWYFRFLFEAQAYFPKGAQVLATVVLPNLALVGLLLLPWIHAMLPGSVQAGFRWAVLLVGVAVVGVLTASSIYQDLNNESYLASEQQAAVVARRAVRLANAQGVPPGGAAELVARDPMVQGPLLFQQHCLSCHNYLDDEGKGRAAEEPSAPNLHGFASRQWIAGFLDPEQIAGEKYFGNSAQGAVDEDGFHKSGGMVEWVQDMLVDLAEEDQQALGNLVVALSAEAKLPAQLEADQQARDEGVVEQGVDALLSVFSCIDCHKFHDEGELGIAPDLTGYGSEDWLVGMVSDPEDERFYVEGNDRMPAFAAHAGDSQLNLLSELQLRMIAKWLRGDDPIAD